MGSLSVGIKQGWGGEHKLFYSFYASVSQKWYEIRPKLLFLTDRKLNICQNCR